MSHRFQRLQNQNQEPRQNTKFFLSLSNIDSLTMDKKLRLWKITTATPSKPYVIRDGQRTRKPPLRMQIKVTSQVQELSPDLYWEPVKSTTGSSVVTVIGGDLKRDKIENQTCVL